MVTSRLFRKIRRKVSPNIEREVFIVTETTTKTGFAAAGAAAKLGGEVVILGSKSDDATSLSKLQEFVPKGSFQLIDCDLHNSESMQRAIKEIKSMYSKLYCFAHGAGVIPHQGGEKIVVDDHDALVRTHLSHIFLATEFLPLLEAQAKENGSARIVNHSSLGYVHASKYFQENEGNLSGDATKILGGDKLHRYFRPKLAHSIMRSPTAFGKSSIRPGTPLLVLAQFVQIKKKGVSKRGPKGNKPGPFVYAGIY
eukprot:CAMPEP_0197451832 /NCGR_PEP_ID=MMETSP1175-20131217/30242_1 /TAXON_ID=1003142 /ORGANISM="Triceratium dubium, Strain CCMP147" /LENGTH=253 /DNA_ID=CAMNT_0042984673 /DNA_START=148 /DNA_END=909 /DNA_ORIENTATION=-